MRRAEDKTQTSAQRRNEAEMNVKPSLRLTAVAGTVTAALLVGGCASSGSNKAGGQAPRVTTLRLADAENTPEAAQAFTDAVNKLSGGSLQITIKLNWRAGIPNYESALIKDVEHEKADLGIAGVRAFDTVGVDSFQALVAPFLIDSYPLEKQVLTSDIPARMLGGLTPAGLTGLAVLPGPLRKPLGLTRHLVSASDYQGARVGSREGLVDEATMRALGATPVTYVPGDTSSLDGMEIHLDSIPGNQYDRNAVELTGNVNLWPRTSALFVNSHTFTGLSPRQRQWLQTAASQALSTALAGLGRGEVRAADLLCTRGLKIVSATNTELAELRRKLQPVYDRLLLANPQTKALIAEIQTMRQASQTPPATAGPCDGSAQATKTTTVTPLDGTWRVSYTRAELLAAGADPSEDLPANYGTFTLTFHRGDFSAVASEPTGSTSGTYLVKGNKLTYTSTGGCCIGDSFTATWSVYRDTLTFTGDIPTGMRVKPWRRVSP
jgi:TRAP-type C4-dicarboxylate transport system substrate-binding protein